MGRIHGCCLENAFRPTVLFFSRPRSEGWPQYRCTFSILSLSSVILIDSFTGSPVHILKLSIQTRVWSSSPVCTWHSGIVHYILSSGRIKQKVVRGRHRGAELAQVSTPPPRGGWGKGVSPSPVGLGCVEEAVLPPHKIFEVFRVK